MAMLKSRELGRVWLEYLAYTIRGVRWIPDNRESICEANPILFSIGDFSDPDHIIRELGSSHIIEMYRKKMYSRELIPELNSTYGDRFFDNLGYDQISGAIRRLRENEYAKSIFLPLVIPNDPGPRIPCLSALQIAIRNDVVVFYATFRSQNVFNAYGNFLGLRDLQTDVANRLDHEPGDIHIHVNFPHIYKSDFEAAAQIVKSYDPIYGLTR